MAPHVRVYCEGRISPPFHYVHCIDTKGQHKLSCPFQVGQQPFQFLLVVLVGLCRPFPEEAQCNKVAMDKKIKKLKKIF